MIKRIELINFMSHARTVIEPADGLTVIVGENNTGKSALIGALQVLCRNAPGDYMIRHGERECRIRVLTDDGHEIEWVRKNRVVSYRIDGRDVHRLGGSVPEDLHALLRLPLVETENEPFDIHFGEQKKPIFLLNESPSRRATFFASSSDTIKLIEMQSRHRRNIQEARTTETELARRETALALRCQRLAPVDALGEAIENLEADYESIVTVSDDIRRLESGIRGLETAAAGMAKWAAATEALRDLEQPPVLNDVEAPARLIRQIRSWTGEIARQTRRISAAESLSPPPDIDDVRPIRDSIRQIRAVSERAETCRALSQAAMPLAPPPCLEDASGLCRFIGKADRLHKQFTRLGKQTDVLDPLRRPPASDDLGPLERLIRTIAAARELWIEAEHQEACLRALPKPPEIVDLSGISRQMEQLASAHAACRRLEEDLGRIRAEQEAARAALTACIEATGVCPTCGQELDPEGFVDRMPLAGKGGR